MRSSSLLFLIILVAFSVRLIGLNFGLPFAYHDDEPIIVNYALAYGTGDFNPHVFKMSPFLSYVLFFLYGVFFVVGYIPRYFRSLDDFAYLYLNNPTAFYIIGRALFGLLCGTASVALLYLLGKRYFNRTTGILAATFLALNYLYVRDSHYLYFDVPLTFFILLFFVKAFDFLNHPLRRLDYIYLGIAFSLALSVKYSGALLGAPLTIALLYNLSISKDKKFFEKAKDVLSCAIAVVVVLFILNPFSFLDFNTFLKDVQSLPFTPVPAHFHFKVSLVNSCGIQMLIFGILGMAWSILAWKKTQSLMVIFAVFYYWTINRSSQTAERLVMSLVPIIVLFAAAAVIGISSLIRKRQVSYALAFALTLVLLWPSLLRIYYSDRLFLREDTRTLAYRWIKENIKEGSGIALDANTSWFPRLEKSKEQMKELLTFDSAQFKKPKGAAGLKARFILENPRHPKVSYRLFYLKEEPHTGFLSTQPGIGIDYSLLLSNKVEYVVLSYLLTDNSYRDFVGKIEIHGSLIKEFSPYKQGISKVGPEEKTAVPAAAFMLKELQDRISYGPIIRIYKLK